MLAFGNVIQVFRVVAVAVLTGHFGSPLPGGKQASGPHKHQDHQR
jgi:hypothetical protein